jgi:predicted ATPase with chaperone activity
MLVRGETGVLTMTPQACQSEAWGTHSAPLRSPHYEELGADLFGPGLYSRNPEGFLAHSTLFLDKVGSLGISFLSRTLCQVEGAFS